MAEECVVCGKTILETVEPYYEITTRYCNIDGMDGEYEINSVHQGCYKRHISDSVQKAQQNMNSESGKQ